MFGGSIFICTYLQALEEEKSFNERCAALPEEMANKLKDERRMQREADEKHSRALQIADAGRARNFWGK